MAKRTLYINGEVITMDKENKVVEAVGICHHKIIAVGTNEEVLAYQNEVSEVIDLAGKTLMPGFIDAHLHVTSIGTGAMAVSCKADHIHSIEDLLADLREVAANKQNGSWIRAWGYNDQKMAEKRYPTRAELDAVSTTHPIVIVRACGHIRIVNSLALELAGIDKNDENPEGGIIEKDQDGELTGVLIETAGTPIVKVSEYTESEMDEGLKIASDMLVEKGITSIHDASIAGAANLRALQKAALTNTLKPRLYSMIGSAINGEVLAKKMLKSGIFTGLGNEKFKIGPLKLFLDGSSSGPTIWTKEPYTSDPENYGVRYYDQAFVDEIFIEAHKQGWQITVHAQGDAAIDMMLTTIERANQIYPRENARHRIEHAGVATPDLIARMKEQGVIPTPNPAFLYEYGDGYLKNYGTRTNHMFPLKDYLQAGIPAAITSDSPVTAFEPMRGIHSAIVRKSHTGQAVGPNQSIDLMDALRMYTMNAAYLSFDEKIKGSLEIGKLADLIILDRPILQTEIDDIPNIQVEMTMINGEVVYQRA